MKNTDIAKIRQLLKTALCPNVVNGCRDGSMPNPYGEIISCSWCDERIQALALLPYETCNGTGHKIPEGGHKYCKAEFCNTFHCGPCGNYIPLPTCPDCQKKPIDK